MDVRENAAKGRPANVEKHARAGHESGPMLNDREAREVCAHDSANRGEEAL